MSSTPSPSPTRPGRPYLIGKVEIKAVEDVLRRKGPIGAFVVRESTRRLGALSLSIRIGRKDSQHHIQHFAIEERDGLLFSPDIPHEKFSNLDEFVQKWSHVCIHGAADLFLNDEHADSNEPMLSSSVQEKNTLTAVLNTSSSVKIDTKMNVIGPVDELGLLPSQPLPRGRSSTGEIMNVNPRVKTTHDAKRVPRSNSTIMPTTMSERDDTTPHSRVDVVRSTFRSTSGSDSATGQCDILARSSASVVGMEDEIDNHQLDPIPKQRRKAFLRPHRTDTTHGNDILERKARA